MGKVLILANNDMGLYKFRRELIEELLKHHEVLISVPSGEYAEKLVEMGCRHVEAKLDRRGTNPITDMRLFRYYCKLIKKTKPDVVLTYTIKPNVYGGLACRLLKIPYIPNITGLGSAVENGGLLQRLTLFLYRAALKKASCVFFQNAENQEFFLKKRVMKGRHRLIPGSGVNLEHFGYLEYPEDDVIRFFFISRIMKEKGIEQFLDAARVIKSRYENTEFHILGFCEEAYEEKLRALQQEGVIIYHGRQNDVREFHKISHCTVHPTYYPEGMSNVLLESAACGRPIITTDRSGCREIVEDGVNGFVVRQKYSADLIDKIESFLSLSWEQRRDMGLAGREKVENCFDRNSVIDAYMDEINYELKSDLLELQRHH